MRMIHCGLLTLMVVAQLTAAEKPKVTFLDREFTLAWIDPKPAFVMNEYTLPGEKVEKWTELLTIAHAPGIAEPSALVESVLKTCLARGLLVRRPQVMSRDGVKKGDDLAVMVVQKDPATGQLELSLQRYAKEKGV